MSYPLLFFTVQRGQYRRGNRKFRESLIQIVNQTNCTEKFYKISETQTHSRAGLKPADGLYGYSGLI